MDTETTRQLIGNCRCIIIFKENQDPIELPGIDKLGLVNRFFIVVEPATQHNKSITDINDSQPIYRLGFCQRTYGNECNNITIPVIPINASFKSADIKDIILTKFARMTN